MPLAQVDFSCGRQQHLLLRRPQPTMDSDDGGGDEEEEEPEVPLQEGPALDAVRMHACALRCNMPRSTFAGCAMHGNTAPLLTS